MLLHLLLDYCNLAKVIAPMLTRFCPPTRLNYANPKQRSRDHRISKPYFEKWPSQYNIAIAIRSQASRAILQAAQLSLPSQHTHKQATTQATTTVLSPQKKNASSFFPQ